MIIDQSDLKIVKAFKKIAHNWMNSLQEMPDKSLVALPVVNLRFSQTLEQTENREHGAHLFHFVNRCVRVTVLGVAPFGIRTPERKVTIVENSFEEGGKVVREYSLGGDLVF